ncbi:MAG: hypothetical protein U0838_11825 [Chloroflexota bacterium]
MANARLRQRLGDALLLTPAGLVRAARLIVTIWALAIGGAWALTQVHGDLRETIFLPTLLHLVRDGALAVPLAALAVCLGGLIAGELIRAGRRTPESPAGRITWAIVAALVFAALSIPGNEIHAILLAGLTEGVLDVFRDALVALAAALAVLTPLSLTPVAPWPPARGDETVTAARARLTVVEPTHTNPIP